MRPGLSSQAESRATSLECVCVCMCVYLCAFSDCVNAFEQVILCMPFSVS